MDVIGIALAPARFAAGLALDVLFGKPEPFEYPHSTAAPLDTCCPLCPGVASCERGWAGRPCYVRLREPCQ